MNSPTDSTTWIGHFVPAQVMIDKRYPRIQGAGRVHADADGLRFSGLMYDTTNRLVVRMAMGLMFAVLVLLLFLLPAHTEVVVGIGISVILAGAMAVLYRDKMGLPIDASVPWSEIERYEAGDEIIVLWLQAGPMGASDVPSPVFFSPAENTPGLTGAIEHSFDVG